MREIKFRAWLLNHKKMVLVDEIDFVRKKILFKEDRFPVSMYALKYELMQYTGLKDKNGKEIYEGDIILWGNTLYEVIYICDGYKVKYIKNHNPNYLYDFTLASLIDCGIEVIGNIYENPELLEVKE